MTALYIFICCIGIAIILCLIIAAYVSINVIIKEEKPKQYILKANTDENGWSFEGCYPVLYKPNKKDSGLSYIFDARNMDDANIQAARFIFYFSQEYAGESNILDDDVESYIEKYRNKLIETK